MLRFGRSRKLSALINACPVHNTSSSSLFELGRSNVTGCRVGHNCGCGRFGHALGISTTVILRQDWLLWCGLVIATTIRRMAQKVLGMPRLSSDNVPSRFSGALPGQYA